MEKASSRLTTKYQATIPLPVREALGLKSGDSVLFQVKADGTVDLSKLTPLDAEYMRALNGTLHSEWSTNEDEAAYRDL